ncbi:MAG: aminotransferase class I/II-fold pyridoxal phosphate-dependent enzyme [Polyangiaceae bacterium]|nr:aminotransferase class I/II-fold pyridoxal phosphate-dependent enzyme [Polyangiaceae bacterium]
MGDDERQLLLAAFDSNWISTVGPHVDAFEREMADLCSVNYAAGLASGTAALHLSLLLLGVQSGDEVFCSDLTFAATANAITYVGAHPVFIDSNASTWNMDPDLLEEALKDSAARNKLPKAVIVVDLYGQCADYQRIVPICEKYGVPLIEDAAEALGATYRGNAAGTFGVMSVLSFNGNKIITTSGGGMLLSNNKAYVDLAKKLATQAREPVAHYEHTMVGYNYRLSNLLAAVGRGQLRNLADRVNARRATFEEYQKALGNEPGVAFMPEIEGGRSTRWLTCLTVNPSLFGASREQIRLHLETSNIEARAVWKPMHLQPVYKHCRMVGGSVSEYLFEFGLCLPSGSNLTPDDKARVIRAFLSTPRSRS